MEGGVPFGGIPSLDFLNKPVMEAGQNDFPFFAGEDLRG